MPTDHNSALALLKINQAAQIPSGPVEHGHKAELIDDIRAYIHKYVDLSEDYEHIAAYYVLLSWVYDAFAEVPYLRLLGDWGTGKTRALTTIGSICYKPFFASGASTVSPIFHIQDTFAGTLVLDEADLPFSDAKAELVKILNNGTAKGMPVLRSIVNRYKELNPRAFRVFGPKLVATRERFDDPALESRFITEQTGHAPLREDIPITLPGALESDALALRNRLLHFRLCEYFKIRSAPHAVQDEWAPRLKQMAHPLLSIADTEEERELIGLGLSRRFDQNQAPRTKWPEHAVLVSAYSVSIEMPNKDMPVGRIAGLFNREFGDTAQRSSRWVGSILRNRFGLTTRKSKGVYVIPAFEQTKIAALALNEGITS